MVWSSWLLFWYCRDIRVLAFMLVYMNHCKIRSSEQAGRLRARRSKQIVILPIKFREKNDRVLWTLGEHFNQFLELLEQVLRLQMPSWNGKPSCIRVVSFVFFFKSLQLFNLNFLSFLFFNLDLVILLVVLSLYSAYLVKAFVERVGKTEVRQPPLTVDCKFGLWDSLFYTNSGVIIILGSLYVTLSFKNVRQ